MPTPTLVLDEVKGAQLDVTPNVASYVRTGHVDNMELADTPDADALVKVLNVTGMPAFYSPLGALSPNLKLIRIRILPSDAKVQRVNLELTYETLVSNLPPTIYLLRDRSFSIQKKTCTLPGTRIPMILGFGDPAATIEVNESDTTIDDLTLIPDLLWQDLNFTARSIQLTVMQVGRPSAGTQNYVNYVNDAPWPTGGVLFPVFQSNIGSGGGVTNVNTAGSLPKGYWRINSYSTAYDRNRNMTLVETEAITQVIEDWSFVGMMRNEKTGKFPFAGLDSATRSSVIADLNSREYSYGYIYPLGIFGTDYGIGRWGPYPLVSFPGLMGF